MVDNVAIPIDKIKEYVDGLYSMKDISLPESREYYNEIRTYFLSPVFETLSREDFKNDKLFNRMSIVRKHNYKKYCELRSKRLIVSLTSYPARIGGVAAALGTILDQTHPADEIVLWLGNEKFPNKTDDLPAELRKLVDSGQVTIKWCKDLKPHTKYFHAFKQYSDDVIVTVDDDILYVPTLLEELYDSYLLHPDAVSAARVHLIRSAKDGTALPYSEWTMEADGLLYEPSMQLLATGVGGVLYPPHLIVKEVLDEVAIIKTCLGADDLWLKAMELISDVPVVCTGIYKGLEYVPDSQKVGLLYENVHQDVNDVFWGNIIEWVNYRYGEGTLKNKFLSQKVGCVRLIGDVALHQFYDNLDKNRYKRRSVRDFQNLEYIRVDIENRGADVNNVDIVEISDPDAKITEPEWLCKNGHGHMVKSIKGTLDMKLKCTGCGELVITLRGMNFETPDGNKLPIWIDYTKFVVDDKVIFDGIKPIWHDKFYRFTIEAEDGKVITVHIEWVADNIAIGRGKEKLHDIQNPDISFARIDIKNQGADANAVDIIEISDPDAKITEPEWLCKKGCGHVLCTRAGSLDMKLKSRGAGELVIRLRGMDIKKPDGERWPLWIDYTKFIVDNKVMFDGIKAIWHDKPYRFATEVEDGKVVNVHIEWVADNVAIGPGKAQSRDMQNQALKDAKAKTAMEHKRAVELNTKLKDANAANEKLERELADMRSGMSFRIGRAITYIPRKILGKK